MFEYALIVLAIIVGILIVYKNKNGLQRSLNFEAEQADEVEDKLIFLAINRYPSEASAFTWQINGGEEVYTDGEGFCYRVQDEAVENLSITLKAFDADQDVIAERTKNIKVRR